MCIGAILQTHSVAKREGKPPFFFSRFNFVRMRERRNTHYCFHCGGGVGFKYGANGKLVGHRVLNYDPMKRHDAATHADGVVGDADQFDSPWQWLDAKIGPDFPFVVTIPCV